MSSATEKGLHSPTHRQVIAAYLILRLDQDELFHGSFHQRRPLLYRILGMDRTVLNFKLLRPISLAIHNICEFYTRRLRLSRFSIPGQDERPENFDLRDIKELLDDTVIALLENKAQSWTAIAVFVGAVTVILGESLNECNEENVALWSRFILNYIDESFQVEYFDDSGILTSLNEWVDANGGWTRIVKTSPRICRGCKDPNFSLSSLDGFSYESKECSPKFHYSVQCSNCNETVGVDKDNLDVKKYMTRGCPRCGMKVCLVDTCGLAFKNRGSHLEHYTIAHQQFN